MTGGHHHRHDVSLHKPLEVRDVPTVMGISLLLVLFLYLAYLVKDYLAGTVFYIPRRQIVGHAARPAAALSPPPRGRSCWAV